MSKSFFEVAYTHLAMTLRALQEPLGKMHIIGDREIAKQRLQGALSLFMAQVAEVEVPEDQKNPLYAKLINLAESIGRVLGVQERELLEHQAARIKGRHNVPERVPTAS
jgi:hypothetical protein